MTVKEIIDNANQNTEQFIPAIPDGVNYVNKAIRTLNKYWGTIIPKLPVKLTDDLIYVVEFTKKLGKEDPNNPNYKSNTEIINKHNEKMVIIDETICSILVDIVAYYMFLADEDMEQLEYQKQDVMGTIKDMKSKIYPLINDDYKYESITGNDNQVSNVFYGLGKPKRLNTNEIFKKNNKDGIL